MYRVVAASGWITCLLFLLSGIVLAQGAGDGESPIDASPSLPFHAVEFSARPPLPGWESGTVSWVALGADGLIYEIQRGDKAGTVLVLNLQGTVVRSWGKGDYAIPHSIRIDPEGNIWTVDASLSTVTKYSRQGKKLLVIQVGEQPDTGEAFKGATDIAFAPDGHLLIADGYGNARILEYSAGGKRLKQWGAPGRGPGEFQLPHSIQVAADGTIYVADRENGRIEKFDRDGKFLAEYPHLGRVYSLRLSGDVLWASSQPLDKDPASEGWIIKLDRNSGQLLGHIHVTDPLALHSIEVSAAGEPVTTSGDHLLWFRHD